MREDRIDILTPYTKEYFMESNKFFFSPKFINRKKKVISLMYGAYSLEYNFVLQDYRIFFENKLKDRFVVETRLFREYSKKRFTTSKYGLAAKNFLGFKFYPKNFDLSDLSIRSKILFKFNLFIKERKMTDYRTNPKTLTKKFFYNQLLENGSFERLQNRKEFKYNKNRKRRNFVKSKKFKRKFLGRKFLF